MDKGRAQGKHHRKQLEEVMQLCKRRPMFIKYQKEEE